MSQDTDFIDSATLQHWLEDAGEIALVDVREAGLFGAGHALLAVNIPFSRLELDIGRAVPRRDTRAVLVAEHDAAAAEALAALRHAGYTAALALAGGTEAWEAAGHPVLQGVNVPSKAFAEFVEQAYHTPEIQPEALQALQHAGADLVLLDSRTVEEYRRFHVPGAISCPGSELPYRFEDLVTSPTTRVVVTCAGRIRGVMGAQTLIDLGVPNPVQALSGGTQGWRLAGLALTGDNPAEYGPASAAARAAGARRAAALAERFAVPQIEAQQLESWRAESGRTTYVFDVRTREEYRAGHLPGAQWVQGVQLIQCLDQWAAVRGARLVLVDDDGSRATATAHWLRQLGWDAVVLRPGQAAPSATGDAVEAPAALPPVERVDPAEAAASLARGALLIDASDSARFRRYHAAGARWGNRSRLAGWDTELQPGREVLVTGQDDGVAQLFAASLARRFTGRVRVRLLPGGAEAWTAAGLPAAATPDTPADEARIDFLFWLHDRHEGNAAASAAYLQWEAALPRTIGAASRAGFRFPSGLGRPAAEATGQAPTRPR